MAILDQIELPNGITYDFQDNQPAVLDIPNTPAPIVTFSGASNLPLSSLKVAVTPYQDLHGYDGPWAGGAGKNKLDAALLLDQSPWNTISIQLKANTAYTMSSNVSQAKSDELAAYFIREGISPGSSTLVYQNHTVTITTREDGVVKVQQRRISGTDSFQNYNWQIEEGSTATTYAPYSNICPIIGWDEAVVSVSGINVWDEEWEVGSLNNTTGLPYSDPDNIRSKNYCPCSPNTDYYFCSSNNQTLRYYWYDADKNIISNAVIRNAAVTSPSNARFFKVRTATSYGSTYNNDISINYPSTDTSYHAYNGATYTIDLNGTSYGGTLDVTNGVLTVDRVGVDLTQEMSGGFISGNYLYYKELNLLPKVMSDSSPANIISEGYQKIRFNGVATTAGTIAIRTNNYIYINTGGQDITPIGKAVYELATPITVQLSPTPVKSLEGENNIFADCGQITEGKYVVSKYDGMTAKISEFAEKANQLTTDAGSNLNPVYFNNGVPVASIGNSVPFVVGTGTTAGTWLGSIDGLTAYYDGLLFLYKPSVAGASTTTLNLNNLGAKTCYANGSTKLTTHYPANQPILLTYSASTNSGCFVAIDNYWSSNTIGEYAGACKAGTNGMARYSLIMQTKQSGNDETWESLVTTSSTATSKTKNSSGFIVGSPVLYQSAGTYAKNGIAGTSGCWSTAYNVDTRYSCNVSSSWSAEGRPFFIKGTINTLDGLFYLADTTWWSDAYPTTNDGFYYIYVGQMSDAYRLSLYPENPVFYYDGGLKVLINGSVSDAQTVNGHTVAKDVPSNAVFTDTKNTAGSTDTSSKLFLIGATSQAASSQTYSQDTAYVGTDGCLYSHDTKVLTEADSYQFIGNITCSNDTIDAMPSAVSGSPGTYTINVKPWLVTDYGECNTAAATAAKVVSVTSNSFNLYSGVTVRIKFDYTNTASAPTLNVNSTGAKNIVKWGTTAVGTSTSTSWTAGSIVSFTYDGTSWVMNDHIDNTDTNNAVLQSPTTTDNNFEVLFSNSANDTAETAGVRKDNGFLYNAYYSAVTIGNRVNNSDVGLYSLAQGMDVAASGESSHAEGRSTTASGAQSHAEGYNTIANHRSQHVFGEYNISDPSTVASTAQGTYVEIVGNGTGSGSYRSNARTLDWSGNQWIAGNYSDTNGLLAMKEVTQAQYDALTTDEKNNGTAYFITDRLSPAATDLWAKVGTATLTTVAQGCSGAINELKTSIDRLKIHEGLINVAGWNGATTATAFNLNSGMKFSNYRYLIIQIRSYSNPFQSQLVTRDYFESTTSSSRPIFYVNTTGYKGTVEVYYKSDTSIYIKTSSDNSLSANYRLFIYGCEHV